MEFVVENSGCRLHAARQGRGPVLLLIHGVACDSNYFKEAAGYLAEQYTVVTYDRRGYSKSEAAEGAEYGVIQQAEDARAILDAIGCERAIIAGCSAGGIIALELAQRYPDRVEKLFLHEPAVGVETSVQQEIDQWRTDLRQAAEAGKMMRALLILMQAMGGMDGNAPGKSMEQQRLDLENLKIFLEKEMKDFLCYGKQKTEGISLRMPCVLAIGEDDREGLFSRSGVSVAKYLDCPLLQVPGYHNLASDRPYDFAEILHNAIQSMK